MEKDLQLRVQGNTYVSDFEVINSDLLFFHRQHVRSNDSNEIDVFGNMWSLAVAKLNNEQVTVKKNNELMTVQGLWAAFIPPFSIIDWNIKSGLFEWGAYLSTAELPSDLPKTAIAFPLKQNSMPQSLTELFDLVRNRTQTLSIHREEGDNLVAKKTKIFIDDSFEEDLSFSEIASQLGVSHSFMDRAFKNAFGLTPIQYKNKLRVSESIRLMLMKNFNVTKASHQVGFNDTSRFNKQFTSFINAKPSEFCLIKKVKKQE